ncbi:hypothetical protein DM298_03600 [Lactobacillus amylovorus]|uniref:Gram-positive cocci surface proteins LPxTG domain-containing protein n=1 Tax=Lactobacillus amylovorus TaxID=1604 RepID=A0A5B8ECC8_LACAM|nr:YSIRK-type signal peptide-containing protein [Lactobacillus amylovorus]QDD70059.1 hypothetical protein DM298_03600 [Lactobacillus amylovorus]
MVRKKNKMFVDSADRTPHYSLRKLSVGVASVLLSTTLWMGANGSVAHADTINNTTVAGKVENDPSETQTASNGQTQSQNGQGQDAASVVTGANQTKNKEGSSDNAEAQTATANDAQADVAKQEPAAQSQQTAPQAQDPASAGRRQASTAEQAAGQASAAATEGQTNGSANADAANNATTEEKKDSANPEANSSAAATEDAKNESTTLDVNQAFKMPINKKMVMASLASADKPTNMASSISELEKADTTAVPGFSVTDPEYPSGMYRDPDPEHYSFFWVGQTDNSYQTVISTNRNGDGQIHVFELDQNNNVFNSFDLKKNQSHRSGWTGATYFNDEYAGLVWAGSTMTLKYDVSGGESDHPYGKISFIVPRLNTQVTSYHDEDGNDIIDNNGEKIESVVQRGLDGQKYTTTGTKLIDGYYAKAPSNAQGTMSPYGKIGSKYEKNYHDGYIAEYTQINNFGDMSVQIYKVYGYLPGRRFPQLKRPIIIKPGDTNIDSGVEGIHLKSIYVQQTTDIEYVYKKLGTTFFVGEDNKPFMGNIPTQYPNDPKDPTGAGEVVIPQYEGYTPKINGVVVGFLKINGVVVRAFKPNDPGEDTKVVYTANSAAALVKFIDNTEHRTLDELESTGKTDETIDFAKANAQLKSYLDRGYNLVANEIPTTETKFDTSDDTNGPSQVFEVHLKHGKVTVTPDNPVNPGDKINPNDPASPTYTPDQATVTEDHTLTVHYVGAPKNPADKLQKSHWTREVTIDKVTGKTISSTDWVTKDSYVKVDTPKIDGYTPDKNSVYEQTVRENRVIPVTYTANSAAALVKFIDNTEHRTLDELESTGKTDETIDFAKANAQLKSYLDRGYNLVANEIPTTETKFDTSDDTNGPSQVFEVHLKHGKVTVTPDNPVNPGDKINPNDPASPTYTPDQATVTEDHTLTVHYVGAPKNPADKLQKSHWTREVTIDKVTGKTISSTDWVTKDSYVKVDTPKIDGYTPDKNSVYEQTVRENRVIPVTYTANSAAALVKFIDNTEHRTLDELESTGKTDETIDFAKANAQLKSYLDRGYNLVANEIPTTETKFDTSDDTNGPSQVFEVHLKHGKVTVTPDNPVNPGDKINPNDPASPTYTPDQATVTEDHTLTVHYVGAPKNPADKLQKSHWTREVTIDKVTGKTISSTDWVTKDSYVKVDTPKIDGYTPDKNSVYEQTVRENRVIPVTYTANSAAALVKFIDNTEHRTLDELESTGKTDETIDFAKANAQLKSYLDRGYNLVANEIPTTETKFDTSDDTNGPSQVFEVHLKHGKVTVTPDNPVNPGDKINPNDPASPTYTPDQATVTEDHTLTVHYVGAPKNPADKLQKSHWTREVTIDKVTGKTISSTDWVTKDSYVKVDTPKIDGYTPDKNSVYEQTVRENRVIPVTYTANSAAALVKFIDNTEHRTLDELESTGKTDETIDFAKANAQLKSYLDRGYNLVANEIPTTETKFDTSDDTNGPSQVFEVHLKHGKVTVTPDNPVNPGDKINPNDPASPTYTPDQATVTEDHTLTVHYVGAPKNPADKLQKSHWTREVTIDKVTGKTISSTDWVTKDSYVKVDTPKIDGYTPDKNSVYEQTVRENRVIPVTYTANSAAALVKFIDNTEHRTLDELESTGKTDETIDFAKANAQLKSYLDRGYNLVANEIPTTETKFDTSDDTNGPSQVFEVHLKHGKVTVTPDNPVNPGDKINPNDPASPTYTPDQATVTEDHTLTVHYVGAPKNPADKLQKSHWTREVTIDKVTGKTISSTDWVTKDSYVKVDTPKIDGYTPDKNSVYEQTVRENRVIPVTYTANSAAALVKFIDNTEHRTLDELESTGKTDETIDFAKANAQLKSYLDRGYNLVANEIPTTETKFDTSDDTNGPSQVFEVHLKHGKVTVTPDNPVNPGDKINPNDPASPTYTPDQATVTEDHTLTVHYVGAPKNPADKLQKSHWTREVTIDKVTGKTISSTDWVTKDSYVKVDTPKIDGYTPDKNSVYEQTVRENRVIPVTYTANSAAALVKFIDNTEHRTLDELESTGKTDETIDFAKANAQLKSYLDRGYNLVANEIPTTETKFDTSDDTNGPSQVFEVHLKHGKVTVTPDNPVNPGDKINPNDPASPTYTPDQATVTEDHTLTVHYVGAPKNPADKLQKSHWTREVTIDKVTGKTISSTDWVTKDSYVKVDTPKIDGYTPDKNSVYEQTVRENRVIPVTYTANSAAALVKFIDNTEHRTLDELESTGKTDETIDFAKANAQLKSYLDRGYNLVANEIPTTETKFDTSDDTNGPSQVFEVHLKHGKVTVTPDNPVNPGDKINPNDPASPTYTPDQATVTEDHTLTVHYVGAPKNPADKLQKSHWTREVTIDKVTGKTISSTDWVTKDSYVKVDTPKIDGYTPDKNSVYEQTVRENRVIPVTYTANSAAALVKFIDNTEHRTLDELESTGKTDETIDFAKANAQLKSYLDRGYNLVANEIPTTETKFDTSDDTNGPSQVFEVHLKHGKVTVTPDNPVNPGDKINPNDPASPTYTPDQATVTEDHTLTVHYVGAPKNPADKLQKSHWTREVTIDKVTGKTISSTDWVTKDSYVKVDTPKIDGYTPDKNSVYEQTVRENRVIPVTYTANSAAALVKFIDNTEHRTLDELESTGKTDETIDFAKANAQLKSYLDRGYNLVANEIPTTETKFDTSDDTNGPSQVFEVHLKHGKVTVTPDNPVNPGDKINPNDPASPTYTPDQATVTEDHTLTVHYVGAPKNPADKLQKSHWTREVTIDKVTGKTISSTDWVTKDSYVKVDTPKIDGYTPDKNSVYEQTVRENRVIPVTYTANSAAALVKFIDNTEHRTLDELESTGKTDETIDFAKANAQLKSYLDRGYNLVANEIPTTETKFDTSDDTNGPSQVFVVRLDHTMTPGETTVSGKQTVTYVYKDKDGKVVKTKTVEEGTTFTGKTTKDEVTGETTTTWDPKDHKYTEVTTPVEPGYTADKKSVGGETVTPDNPNRSYTVVYTPNGSIVPVDPNGNPIPGTKPVPYETDPTDPTKVVDGKVPEVPGWTPKNGAPVKPSDPTKDTEVPYDHTMTPGETTATGKVEGLPEKPAKSAKAPAEKLVKTPVKAPKAVKTAEPAKTISIKESAQAQDQLPQTGEDNSKAAFGLGLASILGGIGILGAFKRKKKEN